MVTDKQKDIKENIVALMLMQVTSIEFKRSGLAYICCWHVMYRLQVKSRHPSSELKLTKLHSYLPKWMASIEPVI